MSGIDVFISRPQMASVADSCRSKIKTVLGI